MAKNYIKGSYRERETKVGKLLNASIFVQDLVAIANEKGYANITITERKEEDQYGNTHYAYENDFVPKDQSTKLTPPDFQEEVKAKKADGGKEKLPWE